MNRLTAWRFPLLPSGRAAVLIALAAPVALLIAAVAPAAWIVAPALGAAVVALVLIDGLLAGRAEEPRLVAPGDVEIGETEAIELAVEFAGGRQTSVEAALALDSRLLDGGRGEMTLAAADNGWRGKLDFTPSRRGTGQIDRLWLRWTGPMGLGARQMVRDLAQEVRIWPNIGLVRSPALQTFMRDAQYGLIARRIRGEGSQFEALAEYQSGMDRRRIDWKASARHSHLYAKEFETERNNQIVFAFDCGQAMCEPIAGMPRIDRAVGAALATSYVALKSGDRLALYGFAARPSVLSPFISGTQEFHRLQSAAAALDYSAQEPNFTLALATLSGKLQRRSLIVVFSDFTDPTSAELMIESLGRLVSRHLILFVTMADDELESISTAEPETMKAVSMAVTADALLRQRDMVIRRLRQIGIDVIKAPYDKIGTRLIDAYLAIKRTGAIG